jgi:membrane-bound lytic murein transglycosylase A
MAQDTGGAIRGAIRVDYFFGFGTEASENAGRMKQRGNVWILMPKQIPPVVQQKSTRKAG